MNQTEKCDNKCECGHGISAHNQISDDRFAECIGKSGYVKKNGITKFVITPCSCEEYFPKIPIRANIWQKHSNYTIIGDNVFGYTFRDSINDKIIQVSEIRKYFKNKYKNVKDVKESVNYHRTNSYVK